MARKQESKEGASAKKVFMSVVMSLLIAFGVLLTFANLIQLAVTDYNGDSTGNIAGQFIGAGSVIIAFAVVLIVLPGRYLYKTWK